MKKIFFATMAVVVSLTACNSDKTEVSENGDGTMTLTSCGVDYDMLLVEAGTFNMGATSEMRDVTPHEEQPMHSVTLTKDFYLGKTEVTRELWDAVMGTQYAAQAQEKNLPVVSVSWNDCQKFVKKLCQLTGKNFRLPTEAEWEYAARGGNKSKSLQHSGSIYVERVAWYKSNSEYHVHPVATMDINELGFHDQCGNVWEWCQDGHIRYTEAAQTDPCLAADSTQMYVIRGGGWNSGQSDCRYTSRLGYGASDVNGDIGLRLACDK